MTKTTCLVVYPAGLRTTRLNSSKMLKPGAIFQDTGFVLLVRQPLCGALTDIKHVAECRPNPLQAFPNGYQLVFTPLDHSEGGTSPVS